MKTEAIKPLLALAKKHPLVLDDEVCSCKEQEASSINNEGPSAQLKYLLEYYGPDAKKELRRLFRRRKE